MNYIILTPKELSEELNKNVSQEIYLVKGKNLFEKYLNLGKKLGTEIRQSAVERIEELKEEEIYSGEVKIARRIIKYLQKYAGLGAEYLEALGGWAAGAELEQIAKTYEIEGLTLAMMMQNDDGGCQSVMVRTNDGITLMHTEEDDSRPITERVTKFFVAEIEGSVTFVYNDLLPGGSAFGVDVAAGFAMACDVLRLRTKERGVCLAKIIGWMVWRIGNDATPTKMKQLCDELSPLIDGYAINVIYRDKHSIPHGYRASMAGKACHIDRLGKTAGSAIKQVNLLDPEVAMANDELRILSLSEGEINSDEEPSGRVGGYYAAYLDRIRWINLLLSKLKVFIEKDWSSIKPETIHTRIMQVFGIGAHDKGFDVQGKWNPSNQAVAATMSVYVGKENSSAGINLGPSLGMARPTILLNTPTHA